VRFSYVARDDRPSQRHTEPCSVVHTGYRWYLVAFDLDRDDWRTFRIDRIRGRVRLGGRGRRRTVPGGDPAAFVNERLRASTVPDPDAAPGRIRVRASASEIVRRIPSRSATVEPDGEDCCIVTTRGPWSRHFLVWMAILDQPMEVLGPPELTAVASTIAVRLTTAAGGAVGDQV
jgi:predicted DNA-binding transcriptional regulator YafY